MNTLFFLYCNPYSKYKFRLRFPNASNQAASWTRNFWEGLVFFCSTETHMISPIHSHAAAHNTDRKGTAQDTYRLSQFPRATPVILRALAMPLALLNLPSAIQTSPHPTLPSHLWDPDDFRLEEGRELTAVRCPPFCLYQRTVYVKV